ncbi:MAG TPA: peptidoglycan recognition family protein [Bryobacteraceae bacterium]|nr:peptidoglycan recognition family protein [Bryobacteraceae bacterium]
MLRLRYLRAAAPNPLVSRSLISRRLRRWILWSGILAALLVPFLMKLAAGRPDPPPPHVHPAVARPAPFGPVTAIMPVWQVERTGDSEAYSNGLRIDTRYVVANHPRAYLAFSQDTLRNRGPLSRTQPAGIVYHTTESCQAPFEAQDTPVLKRLGESVLAYVRRKRAYHYVIDRFGRVYSVVAEPDVAFHAGHSVWAGDGWLYLDLNSAFLGVAFEAQTGEPDSALSPAQVRAAAMLTEMLRSRYQIPAGNCVTHAQVSVNPSRMLIGYHTDWSAGFPFAALGLPDNYRRPLPALWAFGFNYDPYWLRTAGQSMASGVELAEQELARRAAVAHMPPGAYRKALQKQYRTLLAQVRPARR